MQCLSCVVFSALPEQSRRTHLEVLPTGNDSGAILAQVQVYIHTASKLLWLWLYFSIVVTSDTPIPTHPFIFISQVLGRQEAEYIAP